MWGAAGYQPGEALCKDLLHSWRYVPVNVFPSLLLGNQLNKAGCIMKSWCPPTQHQLGSNERWISL